MLIIADKDPYTAVNYLIEHTNKSFCFKSLIELGQLISSAVNPLVRTINPLLCLKLYKPIKQGRSIQKWLLKNETFVLDYYSNLYKYCCENINMSEKTKLRLDNIFMALQFYKDYNYMFTEQENSIDITTAIFRYKQGYESEYPTNSELPIDVCCEEYRKYLEWKFRKSEV